jgi:DnaJ-class molecular chaperone
VEKDGRVGNLYVEVKVEVPDALSVEGQKLLEEFAEVAAMKY